MKKIKIFLASSITDLKIDRLAVGDFIRQLNDIYFDRGVQFFLGKCEDSDIAISAAGKQAEFDEKIRDSELCIFLFFKKVGDYTRHEFEVALDAFKDSQKPKIVTYFKYVETPEEAQGEVRAFMEMLGSEIGHYYNIYQSIDTLKLGILMQIKLMGLDAEEPKVENGTVTFGGQTVADTAALPMFAGNASLSELKETHRSLTQRYYELREKLSSDLDDEATEEEYRTVASERTKAEEAIRTAEKGVLEAMRSMAEHTARGALSARQVAAYRAFEKGNYQSALEILDFNEIMEELSHNEQMAEGYKAHVQTNVNELLQRIEVLKADGVDKEAVAEIKQIYAAVEDSVEKNGLDKAPLLSYAAFLSMHGDRDKALEVAKQLGYYYSDPKHPADDEKKAELWATVGSIYLTGYRYAEAETAFSKAQEMYKRLAETNFPAFAPKVARVYNDLSSLSIAMNRYRSARSFIKSALRVWEQLAADDPTAFELDLAAAYGTLGAVDCEVRLAPEAEEAFKKAVGLFDKRLAGHVADRERIEASEATGCVNFGTFLTELDRPEEAEEAFDKAMQLLTNLAKKDPMVHEPTLAECYTALGNLYSRYQECEEVAEEGYTQALAVYERVAKDDPEAYEPRLAVALYNLGNLYAEMGDKRAQEYLKRAQHDVRESHQRAQKRCLTP